MDNINKMAVMPMPKLVVNMSLPLMISLLVQSLYNIVDSIFVARISEDALTAVSLAYPIQLLMIAVSVGTSVGINALLSRSIGAKEENSSKNIATTGVILSVAGTAVFMILGATCVQLFVNLFTDDPVIGDYCARYLRICMLLCLGTFIGTMYQRFLQAVGSNFDSMITLVVGAVCNIVLDPILIFGMFGLPEMGIRGAAIATVIGQWLTAVLAVVLNKIHNPLVNVGLKGFSFEKSTLLQIYKIGLPTIVMQALGSVMLTAVNAILIPFSSTAVAFFGVYYKLQSFLFLPMNGLGQASISIVGYCYGAQLYDRIRQMFKVALPIAIVLSLILSVIFFAIPGPLLSIFSASETMLEIGIPALRIISFTFAFGSVTIILGYALSGLGNGVVNMLGTAIRQVILVVPFIWIFSKLLGVEYAWWAFWISEVTAAVYAVLAAIRELRKKGILKNIRRTG